MIIRLVAGVAVMSLALSGCSSYDYLQHSDQVALHSGNAVKANLARETTNPSKKSMNNTSGLGKNGLVLPGSNAPSSQP